MGVRGGSFDLAEEVIAKRVEIAQRKLIEYKDYPYLVENLPNALEGAVEAVRMTAVSEFDEGFVEGDIKLPIN